MTKNRTILTKYFTSILMVFLLVSCDGGGQTEKNQPIDTSAPIDTAPPPVSALPLPISTPFSLPDEISPQQAVAEMQIGINLGNTFDAPHEGDWALAAQESFIIAFKEAGFNHIRIPVTWHEHTQLEAPYEIDSEFLTRVEAVVDWALAQNMYVILNAHHEGWLKENYQDQGNKNRIDSIWIAIATHFKNKSSKLIYEILNEPNGMTVAGVDHLNKRVLSIIRNENPNRLVVFSGNGFSPINALLSADIPDIQDRFLIGNFHSYDPWEFAGQCQQNWGSNEHKSNLRNIYQQASDWAIVNQIPVMVNEFGVAKFDFILPENICDVSERLAYLIHHVSLANEFGIAGSFWDDGGSFSTFDRVNGTWGPEKDILVSEND